MRLKTRVSKKFKIHRGRDEKVRVAWEQGREIPGLDFTQATLVTDTVLDQALRQYTQYRPGRILLRQLDLWFYLNFDMTNFFDFCKSRTGNNRFIYNNAPLRRDYFPPQYWQNTKYSTALGWQGLRTRCGGARGSLRRSGSSTPSGRTWTLSGEPLAGQSGD